MKKKNRILAGGIILGLVLVFGVLHIIWKDTPASPPVVGEAPRAAAPAPAEKAAPPETATAPAAGRKKEAAPETATLPADPPAPADAPAPAPEFDRARAELAYARTEVFKAEAMDLLPLLAVVPHNPLQGPGSGLEHGRNPREGEVWVRINAAHSGEFKEIMAQTADLYQYETRYEKPVTVVLWVGGRPWARETFEKAW